MSTGADLRVLRRLVAMFPKLVAFELEREGRMCLSAIFELMDQIRLRTALVEAGGGEYVFEDLAVLGPAPRELMKLARARNRTPEEEGVYRDVLERLGGRDIAGLLRGRPGRFS